LSAAGDSAGIGRYSPGSKLKSQEVIMLREAQRTSGDEWRRRESNPRKISTVYVAFRTCSWTAGPSRA